MLSESSKKILWAQWELLFISWETGPGAFIWLNIFTVVLGILWPPLFCIGVLPFFWMHYFQSRSGLGEDLWGLYLSFLVGLPIARKKIYDFRLLLYEGFCAAMIGYFCVSFLLKLLISFIFPLDLQGLFNSFVCNVAATTWLGFIGLLHTLVVTPSPSQRIGGYIFQIIFGALIFAPFILFIMPLDAIWASALALLLVVVSPLLYKIGQKGFESVDFI